MRRDPSLTFEGALRLLGQYEPKYVGAIDKILGGALLAAGGVGVAAVVNSPLALLAPLWGWIDQKSEALGLLRQVRANLSERLDGTAGRDRIQLVHAAHTVIAVSSFFDALEAHVGRKNLKALMITDGEKLRLLDGRARSVRHDVISDLYEAEVPAPSAARGYVENLAEIEEWAGGLVRRTEVFLSGLVAWQRMQRDLLPVARIARRRYEAQFIELASTVTEFQIWASLHEHAATRESVRVLDAGLRDMLTVQRGALSRVEALLASLPGNPRTEQDLRLVLARAHRGDLDQSVVPSGSLQSDLPLTFPTIGRAFITPRYRVASMSPTVRPAEERWWAGQPVRDDLEMMLASHVLAAGSTRLPMLLLGHPGAGKSMLTKVLAARLPSNDYSTVRVSLRGVNANSPVLDQIQEGLDLATNRRVEWSRLADQCANTTRVVLLDGLDELLQASNADRTGYLQDVARFQQIEADQERPVVVIITSRTVVADRVEIPDGCAIVKLEGFDSDQVASWLETWREVNQVQITRTELRAVTVVEADLQPELAKQPLLLLMLAIYLSDPNSPKLDENTVTAELYQRIIENFARREVLKDPAVNPASGTFDELVDQQVERLAVAAMAMFNRGTQYVSETELSDDLGALLGRPADRSVAGELGKRLLAEFFFIHASEAIVLGSAGRAKSDAGTARRPQGERTYEFLHATFGEYLVARYILDVLADVAATSSAARRSREPEDDLLFALLSHQPLAVRLTSLTFLAELASLLPDHTRREILAILERILRGYRSRFTSGKYAEYRPTDRDRVRELAAYSANLIMAAIAIEDDPDGSARFPARELDAWRSMVNLWQAGLDVDGWQAMLSSLEWEGHRLFISDGHGVLHAALADLHRAQLARDPDGAARVRLGAALYDKVGYLSAEADWPLSTISWFIPVTVGLGEPVDLPFGPPGDLTAGERTAVATQICLLLRARRLPYAFVRSVVELYLELVSEAAVDSVALALAVSDWPELLRELPTLRQPVLYMGGDSLASLCLVSAVEEQFSGAASGDETGALLGALVKDLGRMIGNGGEDVTARDMRLVRYVVRSVRPQASSASLPNMLSRSAEHPTAENQTDHGTPGDPTGGPS
ncbi:NACHT domain-containing protein [Kribbella sp. NPDC050124]|uniref:NACHT domain-containing protein n=1 Tax=Kribbella sp. NPDC050124 TaxID=3364114 RepID=UPI0037A48A9B